MTKDFQSLCVDPTMFARSESSLEQTETLVAFQRLLEDAVPGSEGSAVRWKAEGSMRAGSVLGALQPWLHLTGEGCVPMTCQRCLQTVNVVVTFDRLFRFAADDATAEFEDEHAEEDVLTLRSDFPLRELVEDELLLAMPPVPMHEVCPAVLLSSVKDVHFDAGEEAVRHPFDALKVLIGKPMRQG